MGWKGVTIMDQRVRFIAEYLKGYFPFIELCHQFGISRKTGYKRIARYEQEGSVGLEGYNQQGLKACRFGSCPGTEGSYPIHWSE